MRGSTGPAAPCMATADLNRRLPHAWGACAQPRASPWVGQAPCADTPLRGCQGTLCGVAMRGLVRNWFQVVFVCYSVQVVVLRPQPALAGPAGWVAAAQGSGGEPGCSIERTGLCRAPDGSRGATRELRHQAAQAPAALQRLGDRQEPPKAYLWPKEGLRARPVPHPTWTRASGFSEPLWPVEDGVHPMDTPGRTIPRRTTSGEAGVGFPAAGGARAALGTPSCSLPLRALLATQPVMLPERLLIW